MRQTLSKNSLICTHGFIGERIGHCRHAGRTYRRPMAISAALEDKIVQRATAAVLNAIYEEDFLGFSYGFRPGRSPHDAMDALAVGITTKKVNFIWTQMFAPFSIRSVRIGWSVSSGSASVTSASSASSKSG